MKSSYSTTNEQLDWVHTAKSDLKKNQLGIYSLVKQKYTQNYINEFVYTLNRRYYGKKLVDRLIVAAIQT